MTAILLASGGLDSTTLFYHLQETGVEVTPVFFDYGQHCVETEWGCLRKSLPSDLAVERIDISSIYKYSGSRMIREADPWMEEVTDSQLYLPYRTLLFFSVGASFAQTFGAKEVYSAYINSNHAKELDCTAEFFNQLDAFTDDIGPVRFSLPFKEWSKQQVVEEAVRLGVDVGSTFSCQLFGDTPCGACPNCVERIAAINGFRERNHV